MSTILKFGLINFSPWRCRGQSLRAGEGECQASEDDPKVQEDQRGADADQRERISTEKAAVTRGRFQAAEPDAAGGIVDGKNT